MNIFVCIKQVSSSSKKVQSNEKTGCSSVMSKMYAYDLFTLETVLYLKTRQGDIITVYRFKGKPR